MPPEFGAVLREIRKKNDWTLAEMAEKLGTTKQAISKYERGERTPKITVVAKFSEILDIPMSELAGGLDSDSYEAHRKTFVVAENMGQLAHVMQYMTEEDYNFVVAAFDRAKKKMKEMGIEP